MDEVIQLFERVFPDRIRGYYLHGSVADDTSIPTSDVDLDVVVKGRFEAPVEQQAFTDFARALVTSSDREMDIEVIDEAELLGGAEPTFALGSRLLYGEDIRQQVPLLPVDDWGRERMYRGYFLLVRVFDRPSSVCYPIGFPDPDDEFFGYARRAVKLADGRHSSSTRNLVRVIGWLATALIAYEGKRYVARKRESYRLYREVFNDEHSHLLEEICMVCRERWHYLIPHAPSDRNHLRSICRQALAFENHFLTHFKPFILAELQRADPREESRALNLMGDIPFEDDDVLRAVQHFT